MFLNFTWIIKCVYNMEKLYLSVLQEATSDKFWGLVNILKIPSNWGVLALTTNPLRYSCLENPMGGGAWWAAVHGVARSQTRLSDFTFTFHIHELEKEMATYSSILAWRIPGTGEPSGLPSMGSHRVGHDWSDLAAAATLTTDSMDMNLSKL